MSLWAAVIYIDDFEVGPFGVSVTSGSQTDTETDSGLPMDRVIGGQRDVYMQYVAGGASPTIADNTTMPGSLTYAAPSAASAWLRLQYGLAGAMNTDITFGGVNDGIYLRYAYTDFGPVGTCLVTVASSEGTYTLAKPTVAGLGEEGQIVSYLFSEFIGVDFTDVDAITIVWTNMPPNNDLTASFMAAANEDDFVIPEPTILVLFFLGGLILMRRRRGCS